MVAKELAAKSSAVSKATADPSPRTSVTRWPPISQLRRGNWKVAFMPSKRVGVR